jgi:hypothetical protein
MNANGNGFMSQFHLSNLYSPAGAILLLFVLVLLAQVGIGFAFKGSIQL